MTTAKKYKVKNLFYTLQGEGVQQGRAAVFCRFSGCNLWSGREQDRQGAACDFCDTDFVGGSSYVDAGSLASAIEGLWTGGLPRRFVVFTGGEPSLQLDDTLVRDLRERHFFVAVETNGTKPLCHVDWLCVSPKTDVDELAVRDGDELKFVYPQQKLQPEMFQNLPFIHKWISPMDGPRLAENTRLAVEYCLHNPVWKLNLQAHKRWGVQ